MKKIITDSLAIDGYLLDTPAEYALSIQQGSCDIICIW